MLKCRSILFSIAILFLQSGVPAATIYVDWTYTGLTPDGSQDAPWPTINQGVQSANPDDTVKILPGVYEENVIVDRSIHLLGTGPDSVIIKGFGGNPIRIKPNNEVVLERFTATGGTNGGIYVEANNNPITIILRNIIAAANGGDGLRSQKDDKTRIYADNCTFVANAQSGVVNEAGTFISCIFAFNGSRGASEYYDCCGIVTTIAWSDIFGNPQGNTSGNISPTFNKNEDPMFIDKDTGDYRLSADSPCRNSGSTGVADRNPDGSRNDMGAYGGPGSAAFYYGYGNEPLVTDLLITPASVPFGATFTIQATGKAQ